jgi:hypothetical protein
MLLIVSLVFAMCSSAQASPSPSSGSSGPAAPPSLALQQENGRWRTVFSPSPDHDLVMHQAPVISGYELIVTPNGQSVPLAPHPLGKPVRATDLIVDVHDYFSSLPAGSYTGVVRAVGPGGASTTTLAAPFELTLPTPQPPPGELRIIRTETVTETTLDATGNVVASTSATKTEVIRR